MVFLGGIVSAIFALALAPLINRLALYLGAIDFSRLSTAHIASVPRLGGLLVFFSSLATFVILLPWLPAAWFADPQINEKGMAFLVGALLILSTGFLDDIYGLRARWKLLAEVLVAAFVWLLGLRIEVVTNIFAPSDPIILGAWSFPVFVFWIVLCINAINIIDGIDGLAGGIFILGIVFFLIKSLLTSINLFVFICVLFFGSVGSFLFLNIKKRLYLGDSGSLLLGFILASIVPFSSPKSAGLASVLIPLGVLSVPISEVLVTTIRRLLQGKPVGGADKGHIHYRLLKSGLTVRHVAILINSLCFICGLIALSMTLVFQPKIALLLGLTWIGVLAVFFATGYRNFPRDKGNGGNGRNTLFLDKERVMHRNLNNIEKSATQNDFSNLINDFLHHLVLDSFSIIFKGPAGDQLFVQQVGHYDTQNGLNQSAELIIRRISKQGIQGEMSASVSLRTEEVDVSFTVHWLNALMKSAAFWVDNKLLHQNDQTSKSNF